MGAGHLWEEAELELHRGSLSLGLGLGHSETLGHSGTSLDRVMELALTPLGIPGFTSLV